MGNTLVIGDHLVDGGLDHVLNVTSRVGLGTLARLCESLLHGVGQGINLSIDLGICVRCQPILYCLSNILLLESEE